MIIDLHGNSILCIGDAQKRFNERQEEVDRFHALGHAIAKNKPKAIVIIGDLDEMPSLSIYDGSRAVGGAGSNRSHLGKTIDADLTSFEEALMMIDAATRAENRRRLWAGEKEIYQPLKVFICGNHEMRLEKVPKHIPEMERLIGIHMIQEICEYHGWLFVPFLENFNLWGVNFRHYFVAGQKQTAVGIKQALNTQLETCVWGHTHVFGYDYRETASGRGVHAVCLPTFKSPHRLVKNEESGVVWLNDVRDGDFELARTSTRTLLRKYHENNKSLLRAA